MRLKAATAALSLCVLTACGGGGGSTGGSPTPTTPTAPSFPTLLTSASFSLPTIEEPVSTDVAAGQHKGRVFIAPTTLAPASLRVELIDATNPAAPQVLASGQTTDAGAFTLSEPAGTRKPTDLWLRVTLADGTVLRAFATGWVDMSPGTEVAMTELTRLLNAGAFASRALTRSDLAGAQQAASLYWQGEREARSPAAGVVVVRDALRVQDRWNALLTNLASSTPAAGMGDVAGLMSPDGVSWNTTVVNDGKTSTDTFNTSCFTLGSALITTCSINSTSQVDLSEQYGIRRDSIRLQNLSTPEVLDKVLAQVGELPLIEFPYAAGTQVLASNTQFVLNEKTTIHAAVKITRRTYAVAALQALGTTVPAIKVALDYEIAVLDTVTGKQTDLLARETRWFSPRGGRVRIESTGMARSAGQVVNAFASVAANDVKGGFLADAVAPFAAPTDVVVRGIQHSHAIYAQALGLIYLASPENGGQILELDPKTLATQRTATLGTQPTRLAVSADGRRLYAGLAGGQVAELATSDLSVVRRFGLIADPYGVPYNSVGDISVDPNDPARLLVLATQDGGYSGAVLLYGTGTLLLRDAPRYNANDYGWGYYSPGALAWASTPNEFMTVFLGSPQSMYRFRAEASGFTDVASRTRVEDTGLYDIGGEVLTANGTVLKASDFSTVRQLVLGPFRLASCQRLGSLDACLPSLAFANPPGYRVLFNHATGAFAGAYQPPTVADGDVKTGCPNGGMLTGSMGLEGAVLSPLNGNGVLVSSLRAGKLNCTLQAWTFRSPAAQ